ncbi:MAG: pyridoxamine 5'-phosphate oxidase family protein [Pseudonocardiaceae bacterium]
MAYELDEQLRAKLHDRILWFTTVTPSGRPAPRPVWFVYDDGAFLVFSQATAAKVRHVRANPHVTVHFHTDPAAEHVLVVIGTAALADRLRASQLPAYLHKYEASFPAIGYDRDSFDASFNTCIRITPERAWGF